MQFEDFDKKVRQAADQHHPSYDEKAWAKMERLLDRNLPQEGDRRRRVIFFLLLFLLVGGGVWVAVSKPWERSGSTLSTASNKQQTEAIPSAEGGSKGSGSPTDKKPGETSQPSQESTVVDKTTPNDKPVLPTSGDAIIIKQDKTPTSPLANKQVKNTTVGKPGKLSRDDQFSVDITDPAAGKTKKKNNESVSIVTSDAASISKPDKKQNGATDKISTPPTSSDVVSSPSNNNNDPVKSQTNTTTAPTNSNTANPGTAKKDVIPETPKATTEEKTMVKKSKSKKGNSFFFSVSGGPDVSSVGMDNPGKVKFVGGAGIGYTFNDRWTIRAGFYSGSKVYTAAPEDYNPKIPPPNPDWLKKIDADCKIYEIPLSVSYNFSRSKKHNAFVSTGISSYIMKRETYVYLYEYSGGPQFTYLWDLKDQNKHYFSVLTVSGGYQRKINKLLSIAAEPYIKLPLKGVGFGNIKLNSAGILVSAFISPFQKK